MLFLTRYDRQDSEYFRIPLNDFLTVIFICDKCGSERHVDFIEYLSLAGNDKNILVKDYYCRECDEGMIQ